MSLDTTVFTVVSGMFITRGMAMVWAKFCSQPQGHKLLRILTMFFGLCAVWDTLGCYRALEDGIHTFCTSSDDGSKLYIDQDQDGLDDNAADLVCVCVCVLSVTWCVCVCVCVP